MFHSKYKNTMKKYIFILLTSFSLASCVDLLQEPQSKLTPATIELTEQTLESMTMGFTKIYGEKISALTAGWHHSHWLVTI